MLTLIYFIMSNNLLETLGWKNKPEKQTLNSSNSQNATEKYIYSVGLLCFSWPIFIFSTWFPFQASSSIVSPSSKMLIRTRMRFELQRIERQEEKRRQREGEKRRRKKKASKNSLSKRKCEQLKINYDIKSKPKLIRVYIHFINLSAPTNMLSELLYKPNTNTMCAFLLHQFYNHFVDVHTYLSFVLNLH